MFRLKRADRSITDGNANLGMKVFPPMEVESRTNDRVMGVEHQSWIKNQMGHDLVGITSRD